jgi:hypothetical protein
MALSIKKMSTPYAARLNLMAVMLTYQDGENSPIFNSNTIEKYRYTVKYSQLLILRHDREP